MFERQLSWNLLVKRFWWKMFDGNFLVGNILWKIWEEMTYLISSNPMLVIGSWKHFVFVCVCVCVTLSLSFCKSFVINEMFVIHHLCLACWPCCMLPVIVCMVASHYWANAGQMLLWQGGRGKCSTFYRRHNPTKFPQSTIQHSRWIAKKSIGELFYLSHKESSGIRVPFLLWCPPTYMI